MRKSLIVANLFLMLLLVFTLQAQNHNNNYGNNHQGYNSNHHQQNYHSRPELREFTGVLVRSNDHDQSWNHNYNRPNPHSNNNSSSNNWRADFGILTKAGKHDTRYLKFDEKGNRMVRNLLEKHRKPNNKMYVRVKGYIDRSGTLKVISMSRQNKPDRFFSSYDYPSHGGWNNGRWSFQLFVGLN